MAMTLTAKTVTWPKLLTKRLASPRECFRSVVVVALFACVAILVYALAVIPQLQHRQKIKTIAAKIDAVMPATELLYAVDPDYQPYLFYVERRVVYVSRLMMCPGKRAICWSSQSTSRRPRQAIVGNRFTPGRY
jgi:hypothetical protein